MSVTGPLLLPFGDCAMSLWHSHEAWVSVSNLEWYSNTITQCSPHLMRHVARILRCEVHSRVLVRRPEEEGPVWRYRHRSHRYHHLAVSCWPVLAASLLQVCKFCLKSVDILSPLLSSVILRRCQYPLICWPIIVAVQHMWEITWSD